MAVPVLVLIVHKIGSEPQKGFQRHVHSQPVHNNKNKHWLKQTVRQQRKSTQIYLVRG